jgi:hypothetical protein
MSPGTRISKILAALVEGNFFPHRGSVELPPQIQAGYSEGRLTGQPLAAAEEAATRQVAAHESRLAAGPTHRVTAVSSSRGRTL